jgi:hypothetical protein
LAEVEDFDEVKDRYGVATEAKVAPFASAADASD